MEQKSHLEVLSIGGFSWSTSDSLDKLWKQYEGLLERFEMRLRDHIRNEASETTLETEKDTIILHGVEREIEYVIRGTMGNPAHYLLIDWDFSARHFIMLSLEEHEKSLCMILDDVTNEEGVQWFTKDGVDAHMLYNIIWLEEGTDKCRAFVELYWEDSEWA